MASYIRCGNLGETEMIYDFERELKASSNNFLVIILYLLILAILIFFILKIIRKHKLDVFNIIKIGVTPLRRILIYTILIVLVSIEYAPTSINRILLSIDSTNNLEVLSVSGYLTDTFSVAKNFYIVIDDHYYSMMRYDSHRFPVGTRCKVEYLRHSKNVVRVYLLNHPPYIDHEYF